MKYYIVAILALPLFIIGCSLAIDTGSIDLAVGKQFYQYKHKESGTLKLCSNEQDLPLKEWIYLGSGITTGDVMFCALN